MTDRRFEDVVRSDQSTGHGQEQGYRSLCKDCGTYHYCRLKEFSTEHTYDFHDGEYTYIHNPPYIDGTAMRYVADMRAWNCCNENEEPYDGFPEMPDKLDRHTKW